MPKNKNKSLNLKEINFFSFYFKAQFDQLLGKHFKEFILGSINNN